MIRDPIFRARRPFRDPPAEVINCPWCTRVTKKMPRHGRRTYRHKCSHGNWCPRADKLRQHDNNYPVGGPGYCAECHRAYQARAQS